MNVQQSKENSITHQPQQILPSIINIDSQANKNSCNKPFDYWLKKNKYYHDQVLKFYRFVIPDGSTVLQINCKNGYLLDAVKASYAIGIDDDPLCLEQAKQRFPQYFFYESLNLVPSSLYDEHGNAIKLDYVVLSLATMQTYDIQDLLIEVRKFCHAGTRVIVDTYAYFWEPILNLTQKLGLRRPTEFKNWVSDHDLQNFLNLAGFQTVTKGRYMLLPMHIPLVSTFFNSFIVHLPLIRRACLSEWIIARPEPIARNAQEVTVSVIVPCRNEKGNVEQAVLRTPVMGAKTEIIFVEGNSADGTLEEIKRVCKLYPERNVSWYVQEGKGKGDAVRKGFAHAQGDILMILDGDLTAPPEELPKFFDALVSGKGEFINGSRLVYGMESQAMRFLNLLANFFFSKLFSWLLSPKVKDTLCGTKVLWATDYKKIVANRHFFGNFDPFGDFDLLFGAAKLNLSIIDMPVHYKNRTYGSTQIRRFLHGWILLGMSFLALKKFKFR